MFSDHKVETKREDEATSSRKVVDEKDNFKKVILILKLDLIIDHK